MDWKTMLAYITGEVDENLLLRIEYLVAENRILRGQLKDRLQLSDTERQTLAEIGAKLGKQALEEVTTFSNLIPYWAGTANLSPTNSMAPNNVNPWGGLESIKSWRIGS